MHQCYVYAYSNINHLKPPPTHLSIYLASYLPTYLPTHLTTHLLSSIVVTSPRTEHYSRPSTIGDDIHITAFIDENPKKQKWKKGEINMKK